MKVWPRCRLCARSFGRKPSSLGDRDHLGAGLLLAAVPLLFSAFDTVPMLTFAARATSRMVSAAAVLRRPRLDARRLCSRGSSLVHHFTTPLRKPET